MNKVVLYAKKFSIISVIFFLCLLFNQKYVISESYNDFIKKVGTDFNNNTTTDSKKITIGQFSDGSDFDFIGTICANYSNFAEDRYKNNDFIDAYYFRTKAEKIRRYKIISPSNPYSFGILPDDIEQFLIAREQLRNVSINSIVNSNDGLVLADSYIAFDCWLEAFEEGGSQDRMKRCRNRFTDNMKAMRVSLLAQGYSILDITEKENLVLNNRTPACESCALYEKGQYCNAIYFNKGDTRIMDKMNIVIKRLEQKLLYFNSSQILILDYLSASKANKKLSENRLEAIKNLLYNIISKDMPVKPVIKIMQIKLNKSQMEKKIYNDVITICVSGNE